MLLLPLLALAAAARALRFDLLGAPGQGTVKCIEQYVHRETLVTGLIDIPARQGQTIDVEIVDDTHAHNRHWNKPNLVGENKFSFTVHEDANLRFCFTSTLQIGINPGPDVKRSVYLRLDIGADAKEYTAEKEKLQPIEVELLRLEGITQEVIADMAYVESQDESMYDVNQSTHDRVTNFSSLTLVVLLGLTGWQIWYLHSFFKAKKLI